MSDQRNGNGGNGNQLGGFGGGDPGTAALPQQGGMTDSVDVPGLGNIKRGESPMHSAHNYNRAVFQKLSSADRMLTHLRDEMDKLAIMGDTVSPEDVIAASGRLVGHGVPARELASILAEMPTQAGQSLAAWVARNDTMLVQQEALVAQMKRVAQHEMGVSAIRQMAAEDMKNANRQQMGRMGQLGGQAAAGQPSGAQGSMSPQPEQSGVPEPQMLQMVGGPQQTQNGGAS